MSLAGTVICTLVLLVFIATLWLSIPSSSGDHGDQA